VPNLKFYTEYTLANWVCVEGFKLFDRHFWADTKPRASVPDSMVEDKGKVDAVGDFLLPGQ
jgi:hypothetical protein